jgi:hypothetical protein
MVSSEDIMTVDRKHQADRSSERRSATLGSVERSDSIHQPIDRAALGDFLDQTIAVWQPHADHSLTREDAREIAHNVVGFFRVLREWAEEDRRSIASAESPSPAQTMDTDPDSKSARQRADVQ